MDAVNKFRAEICAKMKEEHEKKFASFEACQEFMKEACRPGKDKQMDGDRKEITSGEGYCTEYFPEAEKKAEKQIDEEDKAAEAEKKKQAVKKEVVVAFPAPGPAPSTAEKSEAAAPAAVAAEGKAPAPVQKGAGGLAPSPAPGGSPAGAPGPAPGPFTPGLTAGKPPGPIPKDEAWYYKKGGTDMSRLHMAEDKKLPTQGYWGKLVEHEDMVTATGDWGNEFGSAEHDDSFEEFCRKHPANPWCPGHEKYGTHSSCFTVTAPIMLAYVVNLMF